MARTMAKTIGFSKTGRYPINYYGIVTYYAWLSSMHSWGTRWGMSGYIMMTRNSYNQCGVATDASYPTL